MSSENVHCTTVKPSNFLDSEERKLRKSQYNVYAGQRKFKEHKTLRYCTSKLYNHAAKKIYSYHAFFETEEPTVVQEN